MIMIELRAELQRRFAKVSWRKKELVVLVAIVIGVRDGGGGRGGIGQFVDMNSGRESTLFGQNTIHV